MAKQSPSEQNTVVRVLMRMRGNDPAHYDDADPDLDVEVRRDGTWRPAVLQRWRRRDDRWVGEVAAVRPKPKWANEEDIRLIDPDPPRNGHTL